MATIYDLLTFGIFAGLAILFLQRSATPPAGLQDKMYFYLPPAAGCAAANWLGNNHQDVLAVLVILAVLAYSWFVLKPFHPGAK